MYQEFIHHLVLAQNNQQQIELFDAFLANNPSDLSFDLLEEILSCFADDGRDLSKLQVVEKWFKHTQHIFNLDELEKLSVQLNDPCRFHITDFYLQNFRETFLQDPSNLFQQRLMVDYARHKKGYGCEDALSLLDLVSDSYYKFLLADRVIQTNMIEMEEVMAICDKVDEVSDIACLMTKWLCKAQQNGIANEEFDAYLQNRSDSSSRAGLDREVRALEVISSIAGFCKAMGIEIECFSKHLPPALEGWKIVGDECVLPKESDQKVGEYVSPILRDPEDLFDMIRFCRAAQDHRHCVEINDSCYLHVHVGIATQKISESCYDREESLDKEDFSLIKQAMINYAHLEMMGLSFPAGNMYIRPISMSSVKKTHERLEQIKDAKTISQLMSITDSNRGSDSINLHALFKHGTIEFRAHLGTIDALEILSWVKCVNDVMDLSRAMVRENVLEATIPSIENIQTIQSIYSQLLENDSCVQPHKNMKTSMDRTKTSMNLQAMILSVNDKRR